MTERVIITVSRHDGDERDVELAASMRIADLLRELPAALGWPAGDYHAVLTGGSPVPPSSTLAEAGIWDGAVLRLVSASAAPARASDSAPGATWKWTPVQ